MPLNRHTTRQFFKNLYGGTGIAKSILLLKRGDDQQQGTVVTYQLYTCVRSKINKAGEPFQGDMNSDHQCHWLVPRSELDRVGVAYINNDDRIVEKSDNDSGPAYNLTRYWQPEGDTPIDIQMFENIVRVPCVRCDPPGLNNTINPFSPRPGS